MAAMPDRLLRTGSRAETFGFRSAPDTRQEEPQGRSGFGELIGGRKARERNPKGEVEGCKAGLGAWEPKEAARSWKEPEWRLPRFAATISGDRSKLASKGPTGTDGGCEASAGT